jgi:methionyl-tRNA synthetase
MSRFYITTPIYYVNDKPHLGTAYSTITADVLSRYHRLFGDQTKFLTGVDEHGQKVQQAAGKRGIDPQVHCDELSQVFKSAWQRLNIQFDQFFRTTDSFHKSSVQAVLQALWDKGDIYADTYEGWYCVSEEIFYTEKDLIDGKTPSGKEVEKVTEKNYFFRMSKYQQALIDHIEKHPNFIRPENRRNEVLGFLRQPLNDLCISRPKSRLSWGIEIPFDREYVTYVWFDALLNYATAVGITQAGREKDYQDWWQSGAVHHLIGKDILITHAVYWPTMLMAFGAALPKTIFAHGWVLNRDNEKMSKSKGSVMAPDDMVAFVGLDPLRYYLVREIHLGNDGPVSHELIAHRVNNDLANNLGNLLSRTTNLIDKFYGGLAPDVSKVTPDEKTRALIDRAISAATQVKSHIGDFDPSGALEVVIQLLNETNKFLEEKAPWKVAKTDPAAAAPDLYCALEVLRISAGLLSPVMPEKMSALLATIGHPLGAPGDVWPTLSKWGVIAAGTKVQKAQPLFPRIEIKPEDL